MYDIDPEKLIQAVKSRPPLYNKNDKFHHGHRKTKEKLWKELFQELNPKWDLMSALDKAEYGREIQKRWKSLRTCFTRELALQRKEKLQKEADEPVKRRKRYEHFNALMFITDDNEENDDDRDGEDSDEESGEDSQNRDLPCEFGSSRSEDIRNVHQIKLENEMVTFPQTEISFDRTESVHERILDVLKDIKRDENDDDRQFILSLIPNFRTIPPSRKLEAKIEMLRVLKNFQGDE